VKWWQFFFLMSAIYVSPRMSSWLAVGVGVVMAVAGFIALWRGD